MGKAERQAIHATGQRGDATAALSTLPILELAKMFLARLVSLLLPKRTAA